MWPQRSTLRNTGPNWQPEASSQASSARTGQVSRRLPRLRPSSTPLPSWSVFELGSRIRSPASVKRRCSRSMPTSSERRSAPAKPTSSRARSRSPAVSPPQAATSFFSSVEVSAAAWRRRLPCWRAMPCRVVRIAGSPADQARPRSRCCWPMAARRRSSAARRVQPGERGEVGGDRGGRRRQRRAAGLGAPRTEMPPVGGVGPQRGRGEGVGGIGAGGGDRGGGEGDSRGAPAAPAAGTIAPSTVLDHAPALPRRGPGFWRLAAIAASPRLSRGKRGLSRVTGRPAPSAEVRELQRARC